MDGRVRPNGGQHRGWSGLEGRREPSGAGLDAHDDLLVRRQKIEGARAAQVNHDAYDGRLGLEATNTDLEDVLGIHIDVFDRRFEDGIIEVQHEAIGFFEQE